MVSKGGNDFLVNLELLIVASLEDTRHEVGLPVIAQPAIMSVDGEVILIVEYILAVDRIEIALAEGKIINSIQHIGLPYPIVADKTVHIAAELKISISMVLEITELQAV